MSRCSRCSKNVRALALERADIHAFSKVVFALIRPVFLVYHALSLMLKCFMPKGERALFVGCHIIAGRASIGIINVHAAFNQWLAGTAAFPAHNRSGLMRYWSDLRSYCAQLRFSRAAENFPSCAVVRTPQTRAR